MANEPKRSQHFSIFLGGAKLATMETSKYSLAGNDEAHVTDGGGVFSDGQPTSTLSANTIVVTDGGTAKLSDAMLNKKTLTVQVGVVDSEIHALKMRCVKCDYDTDVKSGVQKGAFEFIGFEPTKS